MFFLVFLSLCHGSRMEPIAVGPLVQQPLWQAAEPVGITVNYDVPVFGHDDLDKAEGISEDSSQSKSLEPGMDSDTVRNIEVLTEDASAVLREVKTAKKHITDGGNQDKKAGLARLLNLMSAPHARLAMMTLRVTSAAKDVMRKEETPDEIRGLAGSVLTHLTDLPIAMETTTEDDGSYGHVNIVMPRPSRVYGPDKEIVALKAASSEMV